MGCSKSKQAVEIDDTITRKSAVVRQKGREKETMKEQSNLDDHKASSLENVNTKLVDDVKDDQTVKIVESKESVGITTEKTDGIVEEKDSGSLTSKDSPDEFFSSHKGDEINGLVSEKSEYASLQINSSRESLLSDPATEALVQETESGEHEPETTREENAMQEPEAETITKTEANIIDDLEVQVPDAEKRNPEEVLELPVSITLPNTEKQKPEEVLEVSVHDTEKQKEEQDHEEAPQILIPDSEIKQNPEEVGDIEQLT